jgi:hypothetical protein
MAVLEKAATTIIITSFYAIVKLHDEIDLPGRAGFFVFMVAVVLVITVCSRLAGNIIGSCKGLLKRPLK